MLALIEMNLLPGGKRGAPGARGRGRKFSLPKFEGLGETMKGDPWVIAVVALAIVSSLHLGYTLFTQSRTIARLDDEIVIQQADSSRYAENIAAADSLRARQDTIQQKSQIIRTIDADRYVWAHILDEVSGALPDFTWLTSLQQTAGTASDVEFRIDGMTGATAALTRFMRDLEESAFLRDVRLVSQEQTQQGAKLVHNFVLMARYQPPDSSAIRTEPIILTGE